MEAILVSLCLLGCHCRYDGKSNEISELEKLKEKYQLVPVCPEIMGGLSTPREPSEINGKKVLTKSGKDVTEQFERGAEEALKLAQLFQCKKALLKERSPSCGFGKIYDGTHSGIIISGNGLTAQLLEKNDISIFGESEIEQLL